MALTSLHALGVVVLLNVLVEISGYTFTHRAIVEIPDGDYLDPCLNPRLEFETEFHKLKFNDSTSTYNRWVIRDAALDCLTTNVYSPVDGSEVTVEDCLKHASEKEYNTFYLSDNKCVYLETSIPEEFMTCDRDPADDESVIYTTTNDPQPYDGLIPDDHEFEDCNVEVEDDGSNRMIKLDVDDSGSCVDSQYRVTFNSGPGEAVVTTGDPYQLDSPLEYCKMINFTVHRQLGQVPVGDDTCITTVLLSPPNELPMYESGGLLKIDVACEIVDYKISLTKNGQTLVVGPRPMIGDIAISTSRWAGADYVIEFSSDMDVVVPKTISGTIGN